MNRLEAAWRSVEKHCSIARQAQIQPLRQFLRSQKNPHARLLTGQPGIHLCNTESSRMLESLVLNQFQCRNISKLDAVNWLGLIHAVIRKLDPNGTGITQTRLADTLPPAGSPFQATAIEFAECASLWRDALHRWIARSATADENEWPSAILLSAMLHGGLIDSGKIKMLVERLQANIRPNQAQGYSSYSFLMPFQGVGNHHLQRWILDPITDMLVHRYLARKPVVSSEMPSIGELLKKNSDCEIWIPTGIPDFVAGAKAWWSLQIPQIDIQSASRAFQSHAFSTNCWSRLTASTETARTIKPRPIESLQEGTTTDFDSEYGTKPQSDQQWIDDLYADYPWLDDIDHVLSQIDADSALVECKRILGGYVSNSLQSTYLSYLRFLLEGNSASRHRIAFNSIKGRCQVAIPRLLASLGDDNPIDLSTPILEDTYSELVSDPDPALPIDELRYGLRDFHFYLVKRHKKKHLKDEGEIFGDDGTHKYVDARAISFDEYEKIGDWLDDQEHAQGWPKSRVIASRILHTLAFKAGMRRMEILGLRLCDLHPDVDFFAVVRRHSKRRLKTGNSKRLIPLGILLEKGEQNLLKDLINCRLAQIRHENSTDASPYLFKEFGRHGTHAWVNQICRGVMDGLQGITGDNTLHIHHLRHSFATWTYLRLRAPDHPRLKTYFKEGSITRRMLSTGLRFRVRLMGSGHSTTRKFSYAVARLLGHASPEVSLGSYIHACDMLLGDRVWQECDEIDRATLIAASGLQKTQGYFHLASSLEGLVYASRNRHYPNETAQRTPFESCSLSITTTTSQWQPFKTARGVINLALDGLTEAEIGSKLKIPASLASQMIQRAMKYGKKLGISTGNPKKAEAEKLISKPKMPPKGEQTYRMLALETSLAKLLAKDAGLFRDGVQIHFEKLDRRWLDVAFHSEGERAQLLRYLDFLKALDLPVEYFSWTNRSNEPNLLPDWCLGVKAELEWSPKRITQIAPSNSSASFATWAGIRLESPNSRSHGNVLATAIFLAIVGNTHD